MCMEELLIKRYVNEDIFDLMEKGFKNMTRVSIEALQEQELEDADKVLPEEKDDCWSY